MKNNYTSKNLLLLSSFFLLMILASCHKDKITPVVTNPDATPTKLGAYEFSGVDKDTTFRELVIAVSKIGTKSLPTEGMVFDTGSGGMVIDATEVLPSSSLTSTGFNFTGDSTVVNGITITSQTSIIEYGDDNASTQKVYGNLAYAPVTVGDENGSVVIKRMPFFLYYKATIAGGAKADTGFFDIFGSNPQYDLTFSNGVYIQSPFNYFTPGKGLTNGFKMPALDSTNFSNQGTYASGVFILGLTSADLSSSSGFSMNTLDKSSTQGYIPYLKGTVAYGNKTTSTDILFDTGTTFDSFIEDPSAGAVSQLAGNIPVVITLNSGFTFSYITSLSFHTTVENPGTDGGGSPSVFGLPFFFKNSYLLDYTDHKLGVKNN